MWTTPALKNRPEFCSPQKPENYPAQPVPNISVPKNLSQHFSNRDAKILVAGFDSGRLSAQLEDIHVGTVHTGEFVVSGVQIAEKNNRPLGFWSDSKNSPDSNYDILVCSSLTSLYHTLKNFAEVAHDLLSIGGTLMVLDWFLGVTSFDVHHTPPIDPTLAGREYRSVERLTNTLTAAGFHMEQCRDVSAATRRELMTLLTKQDRTPQSANNIDRVAPRTSYFNAWLWLLMRLEQQSLSCKLLQLGAR